MERELLIKMIIEPGVLDNSKKGDSSSHEPEKRAVKKEDSVKIDNPFKKDINKQKD